MAFKDPQRNKEYNRMYYEKHKQERKDYLREYYKQNSEKIKNYQKEYRSIPENKEKIKERDKKYREDNKEKLAQRKKIYSQISENKLRRKNYISQYVKDNREKVNAYQREWDKNKLKTDPVHKIKKGLSKRFRLALNRHLNGKPVGVRGSSSIKLLGCSIPEFMKYMEEQFYNNPETGEKMTWDNWKIDGWHIDHIKPISKFDLNDPKQVEEAVHYTNLQPLWWKENLEKNNKWLDITS